METGYLSLTSLWVWIVDMNGTAEMGCMRVNGTIVCQRGNRPLVTPYDPSQSLLVHMLRAQGAARMPPDRPLPEADIELVERWILNGAKWAGSSPFDAGAQPLDAGTQPLDASAQHDAAADAAMDGAGEGGSNLDGGGADRDGASSDGGVDASDGG